MLLKDNNSKKKEKNPSSKGEYLSQQIIAKLLNLFILQASESTLVVLPYLMI